MDRSKLSVDQGVRVTTRDGASLATTVFTPNGEGTVPAILMRTAYDRRSYASVSLQVHALELAGSGYGVVLQDVRGRGQSTGEFRPFVNEQDDGLDTVDWIASQDWCDGSIGLAGISYNAFTQLALAAANHPAVKCWVPALAPSDVRVSWIRRGGVLDLGFHLSWGLGSIAPTDRRSTDPESLLAAYDKPRVTSRRGSMAQPELAATPAGEWLFGWAENGDPYPNDPRVPGREEVMGIRAPALVVAGWFDVFSTGSIELLKWLRQGPAGPHHRLVAGPWDHSGLPFKRRIGERDFGRNAVQDLHQIQLQWFDQHLKNGNEVEQDRVFVTGRNLWASTPSWPPPTALVELGLGRDGALAAASDVNEIAVKLGNEDPAPVCGGALFPWEPALRCGAFDQKAREQRPDVFSFRSSPLSGPLLVEGSPRLSLPVDTDAHESPVCATLVEMGTDGSVWNVSDGIGRVDTSTGMAEVQLGPIAHEFAPGTALGIDVAFAADGRLEPPEPGIRVIDLSRREGALTLPVSAGSFTV